jgi:hypothetical protein
MAATIRWGESRPKEHEGFDDRGAHADRTVTLNDDRSAALLIRVWVEDGINEFRGRLTALDSSDGAGSGDELTLTVASSPSDIENAVRDWLDAFLQRVANRIDTL